MRFSPSLLQRARPWSRLFPRFFFFSTFNHFNFLIFSNLKFRLAIAFLFLFSSSFLIPDHAIYLLIPTYSNLLLIFLFSFELFLEIFLSCLAWYTFLQARSEEISVCIISYLYQAAQQQIKTSPRKLADRAEIFAICGTGCFCRRWWKSRGKFQCFGSPSNLHWHNLSSEENFHW